MKEEEKMTKLKIIAIVLASIVILAGVGFGVYKLIKKTPLNSNPAATQIDVNKDNSVSEVVPSAQTDSTQKSNTGSKYYFEEVATVNIEGAPLWLFAVVDDQEKVVLSSEDNGSIKMGFFDPNNPQQKVDWKTIVSANDIEGKRIADHWHEFKDGYHWIAFSISEANTGYLMKVDNNLNRVALVKAVENETLTKADLPPDAPNSNMNMPTNDMFLVPTDEGVAAGFFLPAKGHRVFSFDKNLKFLSKTDIGGGQYSHGNGSSAIKTSNGFDFLASESINYLQEGSLKLIKFDNAWQAQSAKTLFDKDGVSIGMVSGLYLDDGSLVVNARVNENAYSQEEMLKKAPPGQGNMTDDGANIERLHYDAQGNLISTTKLYEGNKGHRPHTAKLGDKLLTTWDAAGSYLRIDRIMEK